MRRILFIILLMGCASSFAQNPFYSYVRDFLILANVYEKPHPLEFDVGFGNTKKYGEDTIGVCLTDPFKDPRILILPEWWKKASDIDKMLLMFHELGHCLLGRDHKYSLYLNKDPISIMYPILISEIIFKQHSKEYIQELFNERRFFSDNYFQVCSKNQKSF